MFEKEIQTAKQQLSSHLLTGDTYVYLQEILNNPDIHSFYKGFFRGEVDWWIYEQKMLREANPRFDFNNKEFIGIQQEYDRYCRQTARFDHVELTTLIDLAVKTRVNYLLRPRTTLKWFVYRGEPTKPLHEVLLRFAYFDYYNYLLKEFDKWAAGKLAEASHQDILSVIEFERLIENIDNEIILEHTTSEFAELLSPLYEFFYEVQPKGHQDTIPTPALIIFLDDKGILRISQELERLMKEEDFEGITRQEFLNVIDNVILQVEEETGVPQTFIDDSTIPLDFDSTRRQVTPLPKPIEPSVQSVITEETPVALITEEETPGQVDATTKDMDEPEQGSEILTSTGSGEAESSTSIADSEPTQPAIEIAPSTSEPILAQEIETADIPAEENIDRSADGTTDASKAAALLLADDEDALIPVPSDKPLSESEEPIAESEGAEKEETFTIVDVSRDDAVETVGDMEIEQGEELFLPEVTEVETTSGSIHVADTEPEAVESEEAEPVEVGSAEVELAEVDLSLSALDDEETGQSHERESQNEQSESEEEQANEQNLSEPEFTAEISSISDMPSEVELYELPLPESEQEVVAPDIFDGIDDMATTETVVQVVTDFPDENLEEYKLYDATGADEGTSDSPATEEPTRSWDTGEEEPQSQNWSEEELYSALFPDTNGTNVQSDAAPSVDAEQHEPEVMDQEEVLLETDNDTSGTSTPNESQYSAIEELLDDNLRQRIVKHVFHRNEERFQAVLQRLNATRSWRDASSIIDRVFSEYEVDPYSSIARKFSDIVYERFLTGQ